MIDHAMLAYWIKKRGMTQVQLAAIVGIESTYVSRMCNNDLVVKSTTLKKICEALSIEPKDIWK